ncbi:MAG: arginine--tRNA ligase [Lentisphaerae bacterium GWF2_57_35]|nr:MAG: arginine--tRNA ligase [Lentisphaerae bacterium GWF2_57_35]
MMTVVNELSTWMSAAFQQVYPAADLSQVKLDVVPTADEQFGDYQCNAAMGLARLLKMKPRDIAQAVVDGVAKPDCVERLEVAGAGFLNFYLKAEWLAQYVEGLQKDERMGVSSPGVGRTVIMDYSSPNIAKPMHIGHIRSTVIGNAIDRLHRLLGYRVIADNHFGDWGTQFGIMIMGYRNFVNAEALKTSPIEELERVYRESYEQSQKDEAWLNQARTELVKLQAGDPENLALWNKFIELSKLEFDKIYGRLGVRFDLERGESFYNGRLAGVIQGLIDRTIAEESEGALVVRLEEEKLPLSIVRKSDGGFNYAATDLATVLSRVEEFNPESIVYVTDERQQLHFRQVFAICRRMGVTVRLEHVWFGLMRLPEGTFSTRQGNVIKLERLLDEAEARALAIVKETSPEMSPEQQKEVARAVGIGAIKYADLSQNPQSMITFTWEKALALDGNSAPYLQYAYARIASVQDKYRERFPGKDPSAYPIRLTEPVERKLAIRLVRFGDSVAQAAAAYRPNYLADYLYDLAQVYSSFYQTVPFLKAEEGVRESRVRLCALVAKTLRMGLNLLGIETPERI